MHEALQTWNLSFAVPTRSMAEPPPRYSMMIHSLVPCSGDEVAGEAYASAHDLFRQGSQHGCTVRFHNPFRQHIAE